MLTSNLSVTIPRSNVITALTALRQDWEQSADGHSLLDLNANVGLLLWDVVMLVGLTPPEQIQVFGANLAYELESRLASNETR